MTEVLMLVEGKRKIRGEVQELQPQPALCARYEHPDKAEAVEQQKLHQRFNQSNK